jgi:hypothetical protein
MTPARPRATFTAWWPRWSASNPGPAHGWDGWRLPSVPIPYARRHAPGAADASAWDWRNADAESPNASGAWADDSSSNAGVLT